MLTAAWRQAILNCSRQAGKSTGSGLVSLRTALYPERSGLVLLLAPALRQSKLLMRSVKRAYARLARTDTTVPRVVNESVLEMEFDNGGQVISLPGHEATIRGFSDVELLVVDEASRVPDDLYQAVRPMLAVSRGRALLLSSPFGRRGFYFDEWENGENWHRVEIPATLCPRIDPAWLEEERARIGEWWFKQEYLCQFVDTRDQVFRYEDVEAAYDDDVTPLDLPVFRGA